MFYPEHAFFEYFEIELNGYTILQSLKTQNLSIRSKILIYYRYKLCPKLFSLPMSTIKNMKYTFNEIKNIRSLIKLYPSCLLWLNLREGTEIVLTDLSNTLKVKRYQNFWKNISPDQFLKIDSPDKILTE